MKKIPDNFCFLPWTGVFIDNDSIGPCCVNYKLYNKNLINEYFNSLELKSLKDSFIKGGKHPSCNACWKEESLGIKSTRQRTKIKFKYYYYFTIRLSNKCNFKCRMCDEESSSAWAKDKEALNLKVFNKTCSSFDLKKFKQNIEYILNIAKYYKITLVVIGGEPLISDEFVYFLEMCNKYNLYKNINLSINTNLSVYKYKNIDYKEEFKKFHKVRLHASIDGLENVGEYIRKGYKQATFDYNLSRLRDFIDSLNITIQIYNIYDIPNIHKYAETHNIKIFLNYLHMPSYLSLSILDTEERINIIKYYRNINFLNKEIINALNKEKVSINQISNFIKYTDGLDKLWKTDFKNSIPELKNWYERIKNYEHNMV